MELGLSFDRVASGLKDFRGAERRFDVRGEPNGILSSTTTAITRRRSPRCSPRRGRSNRRIVVAFQPHRYSRTASLMDAFGPALAGADHVVLTDIYAAGEDADPRRDARGARRRGPARRHRAGRAGAALDDVVPAIVRAARPGDVVITLGAGSIGTRARPAGRGARRRRALVSAVARRPIAASGARTSSRRGARAQLAGAGAAAADRGGCRRRLLGYGAYRGSGAGARMRHVLAGRDDHRSAATSGCRRAKCWRC